MGLRNPDVSCEAHRRAPLRRLVMLTMALVTVGCRMLGWSKKSEDEAASQAREVVLGKVMWVRDTLGYAVLECVSLPSVGETATVYRAGAPVAVLQVSGPVRGTYAAADVVRGDVRPGDWVTVMRRRGKEKQTEE